MKVGDIVPDFCLVDQFETERCLSTMLTSGPIVLYFYPAALTAGCTKEGCAFRDRATDFTSLGAQRVGVSHDAVTRQKEFSDRHHFDFPLLSDPDGRVATIFGVRRNISLLPTKRWTFVIGTDRRVLGVIKSELRMGVHVKQALALLQVHNGAASD